MNFLVWVPRKEKNTIVRQFLLIWIPFFIFIFIVSEGKITTPALLTTLKEKKVKKNEFITNSVT